jgi:SAM-dependent methyltransferase
MIQIAHMIPMNYSFLRYLSAKKTVDDRALNRYVWETLARQLPPSSTPLHILEIGAGTGAMLARMLDWRLLSQTDYTAIDAQPENIAEALASLPDWAESHHYRVDRVGPTALSLAKGSQQTTACFEAIDLFDFIKKEGSQRRWDLLAAHAFLDLIDLSASLPQILNLLRLGGLFYFTINFDGLTLLEPAIDPVFDELILELYHRSMDERLIAGKPSGDSRAGRHLFNHLRAAGAEILAAGASDWVVFPHQGVYPADEAYFLHHVIHFFEDALHGRPELDPQRFKTWLTERHAQINHGELTYIAHQLDFVGRVTS